MTRENQRKRGTESAVPELRSNPHPWKRHRSQKNILVRRSDVTKETVQVVFLSASDASIFLGRLRDKQRGTLGKTLTQIQREKLRMGAAGW